MIFLPGAGAKPAFKWWLFCSKYSCNRSGLWPLNIWTYNTLSKWQHQKYGIAFHFLWIADAHFEVEF